MKLLSLFSGIGAFEKALERLNIEYELVGFSEIDKWAIESYCAIHGVEKDLNLGDVSKIKTEDITKEVDIITHGSPCQSFSIAGLGHGGDKNSGTRSSLMWETVRIVQGANPKYVVWENVKNVLSKKNKHNFEMYINKLEEFGYNSYWKVLNAKDYGIPQNRERIFVISIRKDIDNGNFEFPEPIELKTRLKDLLDKEFEDKYIIDNDKSGELLQILNDKGLLNGDRFCTDSSVNDPIKRDVSNCITARYDAGIQNQKSIGLTVVEPQLDMVGKLNIKGHDQIKRVYNENGLCPTLTTMGGGNTEPKVLVKEATKKGYDIATEEDSINISFPNSKTRRGRVGKGMAQTLDTQCNQAVLQANHTELPCIYDDRDKGFNGLKTSDICPTQRAERHGLKCITEEYKIRKLTPLECWRLMGFDDEDYWKARTRLEEVFYNGNDRSNSQMYKQAGNSIVVNVVEAIFRKLF